VCRASTASGWQIFILELEFKIVSERIFHSNTIYYLSRLMINRIIGILHSPVYTFFEKACIIELNADVETGNSKFEIR
jgi:hypothetical protein